MKKKIAESIDWISCFIAFQVNKNNKTFYKQQILLNVRWLLTNAICVQVLLWKSRSYISGT